MAEYPHLSTLYHQKAQEYGTKVAMSHYSPAAGRWTDTRWDELIEGVDELACALMEVTAESENIGIFSRNMPWWSMADLAIMSMRGVSIPIYPTDSVTQITYIIRETGLNIIFAGEQEQYDKLLEAEKLLDRKLKIVVFDDRTDLRGHEQALYFDAFRLQGKPAGRSALEERMSRCTLDDLTTIIYTSGTTGEPKGVMLHFRNFSHAFRIHDDFLRILPDDSSLAFLPLSHIFERAWSLYCLYRGVRVNYLLNPRNVIEAMQVVKPSIMCVVPRFYEKTYAAVYEKINASSSLKRTLFRRCIALGKKVMELKRDEKQVNAWLAFRYWLADLLVLRKGRAVFGGRIRFMPCSGSQLPDHINIFFHAVGINVIYAYGLTETNATVTAFRDSKFKFGTVGKPLDGIELKIGDDNEIWIKSGGLFSGYYKKPEETAAVLENGWFRSGDAGAIDAEGNLIMTERIKDLIKTSTGKFVAPQQVETVLTTDPYIAQAMVIGDNRRFITALIVPSAEKLQKQAGAMNVKYVSYTELLGKPEIIEFMKKRVERAQEELADFQKVKRFALMPSEFSIDSGEFTSTLKIRRRYVQDKYRTVINSLYAEA